MMVAPQSLWHMKVIKPYLEWQEEFKFLLMPSKCLLALKLKKVFGECWQADLKQPGPPASKRLSAVLSTEFERHNVHEVHRGPTRHHRKDEIWFNGNLWSWPASKRLRKDATPIEVVKEKFQQPVSNLTGDGSQKESVQVLEKASTWSQLFSKD